MRKVVKWKNTQKFSYISNSLGQIRNSYVFAYIETIIHIFIYASLLISPRFCGLLHTCFGSLVFPCTCSNHINGLSLMLSMILRLLVTLSILGLPADLLQNFISAADSVLEVRLNEVWYFLLWRIFDVCSPLKLLSTCWLSHPVISSLLALSYFYFQVFFCLPSYILLSKFSFSLHFSSD